MQIVIDMPEEDYKAIKNMSVVGDMTIPYVFNSIRNGIPLDQIRAEIKGKIIKRPWLDFEDRERDRNDAFLEVLDILDKYKAESEEV